MSYADYEICPGCDGKALYMGDRETPDGIVVWHDKCLASHVAAKSVVTGEMVRAAVAAYTRTAMAAYETDDSRPADIHEAALREALQAALHEDGAQS